MKYSLNITSFLAIFRTNSEPAMYVRIILLTQNSPPSLPVSMTNYSAGKTYPAVVNPLHQKCSPRSIVLSSTKIVSQIHLPVPLPTGFNVVFLLAFASPNMRKMPCTPTPGSPFSMLMAQPDPSLLAMFVSKLTMAA
jgi:hypothetical protein